MPETISRFFKFSLKIPLFKFGTLFALLFSPLGFYWLANMQIFRIFSKMIGDMPSPAILKAVDAECRMLEDDFQNNRFDINEDALSILCFGAFVQMVKWGNILRCSTYLPPEHVEFYKETVIRLVQAEELPSSALNDFDYAFKRK